MPHGIPLPRSTFKRLLSSSSTYDIALALFALPIAFLGAMKYVSEGVGLWPLVLPVLAMVAAFGKFWVNYEKDKSESKVDALEGALHVLHQLLHDIEKPSNNPKVRITLHIPSNDHLVQLLDYVGDGRNTKRTAGRMTRNNCGIIGRALASGQLETAKRESHDFEAYVEELVRTWHYTVDEARKLDPSAMSWLAFPLRDKNEKSLAVLFVDSVDANFFTELRILVVTSAATAIAKFVQLRLL